MDTAIWAALIAALSAVAVATISNWDKLSKRLRQAPDDSGRIDSTVPIAQMAETADEPKLQAYWSTKLAGPKEIVQLLLRAAGYAVYVDGFVGPQTTRAIIDFQREHGLAITGLVDDPTERALSECRDRFMSIQKMLIKLGFAVGVDGLCGNNSTAALKQFQRDHNLPVSGLPDEATRRLLREMTASI